MKTMLISLLVLTLASPLSGVAAQTASTSSVPVAVPAAEKAPQRGPRPGDRTCLRSTGSLIPPKPGECLPVAGTSYSAEDLQRTGARDTADALRMLDPAIR